jgi:hypothetical protein
MKSTPLISTPPPTIPILQSCLSLIFKSMFQGISQSCVSLLDFCPFNPFHCSPLAFISHPPFLNSFRYTFLAPLPSQVLCLIILLMCHHSLFLPLLSEFHRVGPLLQTCSTYEFVYDHACFCVYVYLLDLSSMNREKTCGFCVSESGLLFKLFS